MKPQKITVIGNCLSIAVSAACRAYFPNCEVINLHFEVADIAGDFARHADESDLVLAQLGLDENIYPTELDGLVAAFAAKAPSQIQRYPRVVFAGFQPDCSYAWSRADGSGVQSPFSYHSAIAVEAFRRGFNVDQTAELFNADVFEALGYFDYYEPSVKALEAECRRADLPADVFPRKWLGLPFMYSVNHPRMYVAWDLADYLLRKAGFAVPLLDRDRGQPDTFFAGPQWPIYPEIARRLAVPGGYSFMPPTDYSPGAQHEVYDLRGFIEKCFETYRTLDFSQVALSQPSTTQFNQIGSELFDDAFASSGNSQPTTKPMHPYSVVVDHQMWRRAVTEVPAPELDPVVATPFGIQPETRIATAGSCFAQHIAKALQRTGYTYFVTETPPPGATDEAAQRANYGVFSARYGNLYTARQLLQLVQRAYGEFSPTDVAWQRDDGRYVDPFRPQIDPAGFADVAAVEAAREDHFQAVRDIVEQSDVFVFTLGLTEGWRRRSDEAVFPLAPGTAGGRFDPDTYEFVNFQADEVVADMLAAIAAMRERNPMLRFIITVSPVPLIATAEAKQHVLTATTYSKAVLRVAAEQICRSVGDVAYFPSFEIITGNFNRGAYFAEDLREVRMEGVDHVMGIFMRHFAIANWTEQRLPAATAAGSAERRARIESQVLGLYEVVCDEETIELMAGI